MANDQQSWSLLFMEADDDPDMLGAGDGLDSYCLVVDPGQRTYYGGILECELLGDALRLKLTPEAAETLELHQETRTVPEEQERVLRSD